MKLVDWLLNNGFERSHDGTTEILDNGVLIYPFYQDSLHDNEGNKIETVYQFMKTYKKDLLNED